MPWAAGSLPGAGTAGPSFFCTCQTRRKTARSQRHSGRFSTRLLFSATTASNSCHCPMTAPFLQGPGARRQGTRKIFRESASDSVHGVLHRGTRNSGVCVQHFGPSNTARTSNEHVLTSHPPGPTSPQTGLSLRNLTSRLARVFGPGSMRMAWCFHDKV